MQLTQFTDYGLRTLLYLMSHSQEVVSAKEIAEYYGISRNHLAKVVHLLSQQGYVNTIKGKRGGIQIAKDTKKLKLGDLILSLEPNMNIVECFDTKKNKCRITDTCMLKHYLNEAAHNFINTMNQYTLLDATKLKGTLSLKIIS